MRDTYPSYHKNKRTHLYDIGEMRRSKDGSSGNQKNSNS